MSKAFRFGEWLVEPQLNRLSGQTSSRQIEPLAMDVLAHLLAHHDRVVSVDELLDRVWPDRHGDPGMVKKRVAQLRSALGDDARQPTYIETIPKRGYRAIAEVRRAAPASSRGDGVTEPKQGLRSRDELSAIAVLPFDDLSPGGNLQWLTEGFAEDLIDSLSRIEGLHVPARNSTSILKARKVLPDEIGERLAVGSLVTGSVRQVGGRILLAVQWIRVQDQLSMWSARYDKPFENVLEIQRQIASGISEAIRKELGIHDTAEFVSRSRYRTSDARAWEAFRRGFGLVFTFSSSKMTEGRDYLHQSLEIDPDYLDAHAWLAWSKFDRPEERNAGAIRVLERQPSNPVALLSLVEDSQAQWDFETAELLWRYAVAHNPMDNLLTLGGIRLCNCLGRLDEALEVARRGVRLDPLEARQHFLLGMAHLNLGNPAAAIEPLRQSLSLYSEIGKTAALLVPWACQCLGIALQSIGRESEAIDALMKGFSRYQDHIAEGARADGWHGANLALLTASGDLDEDYSFRPSRIWFKASVFASVGEERPMYEQLSELMSATARFAVRDRDALRNTHFVAESLRATAEFQPYWKEPEFALLRRQLDERMARSAGTTGYADLIR